MVLLGTDEDAEGESVPGQPSPGHRLLAILAGKSGCTSFTFY